MSIKYRKKLLAERIHANRGTLPRLGNYQSSRFKPIVLTMGGNKVELSHEEYEEYIKEVKLKEDPSSKPSQPKFDQMTGEPLE